MKTITVFIALFASVSHFAHSQTNVAFAAPAGYRLRVTVNNQTQENEQYVRFENLPTGDHTARITATVGSEIFDVRSTVTLPSGLETSYFVIVVNRTAQVHWSNEVELGNPSGGRNTTPGTFDGRNGGSEAWPEYSYRQPRQGRWPGQPSFGGNRPGFGTCECDNPFPVLNNAEANRLKSAVQRTAFDDDRMALVQAALGRANIMTDDVRDLMRLLSFDNNRLRLAKRLYDRTCDKRNYYLLASAFDFPSNSREFQQYLLVQR